MSRARRLYFWLRAYNYAAAAILLCCLPLMGQYLVPHGPRAGAFLPPDIAGLELWLDANEGITLDVGVTTWGDQSVNGRDAIQVVDAQEPTVDSARQNGLDGILFDGSDWMRTSWTLIAQPLTLYLVADLTSGDVPVDGQGCANRIQIRMQGTGRLDQYSGVLLQGSGTQTAAIHIVSAIADGASSSNRIDGAAHVSGDSGTQGLDGLVLGAACNNSLPLAGAIYEVLLYSGAHSGATVAEVETYLNDKWAVY